MTEAIYLEVSKKTEAAKKQTPGFRLWNAEILRRFTVWILCLAETEKHREAVKAKIQL